MNVAPVKSGKPGRPRYKQFSGRIAQFGQYWAFFPNTPDFFGHDSVLLNCTSKSMPQRAYLAISRGLDSGRSVDVVLRFTGTFVIADQLSFYSFRFVGFASWIAPRG